MSARELAERVEALAARMTQGEWNADPDPRPGMEWNWHIYRGSADRIAFMANSPRSKHDAALIVTLVNAVPEITAALRRIEALEAENARLREGISWAADIFANCAVEMGYCCCGEATETHGFHSGHSPVDQGAYAVERWQAEYAALKGGTGDD